MQIRSANLIPEEFIKKQKYEKTCKKINHILILIIVILCLLISVTGGMCYYLRINQDIDVPPEIKKEYLAAQKSKAVFQKKKELFQKAKTEDCLPADTLYALLSIKPDNIKFTRLEISDTIKIEGFGSDPSSFNEYVAKINENKNTFSQAVVEKISSAPNNSLKTFSIKIAR